MPYFSLGSLFARTRRPLTAIIGYALTSACATGGSGYDTASSGGGDTATADPSSDTPTLGNEGTPRPNPDLKSISVDIEAKASLELPARLRVELVVPDDFEPERVTWGFEGPGSVYFGDPSRQTVAEFTTPGTYKIAVAAESATHGGFAEHTVEVQRTREFTARLEGEFDAHYCSSAIYAYGDVYMAYVDNNTFQKDGKDHARTVIAHKKLGSNEWHETVIDEETRIDRSHRYPALAVDGDGYIHVVYDMHNDPWQYKISRQPRDVTDWEYRGQPPSEDDWKQEPSAAIPGNLITYPNMLSALDGTIYVGYRECAACKVDDFTKRQWSSGLSRYSPETKKWERVGGARTFALGEDYRPQSVAPYNDPRGRVHVAWVWGKQYTYNSSSPYFDEPNYPAYAYTDDGSQFHKADGSKLELPIRRSTSDIIADPGLLHPDLGTYQFGYFTGIETVTTNPDGDPFVQMIGHYFDYQPGRGWLNRYDQGNKIPWSGALRIDPDGNYIALSGGLGGGVHFHYSTNQGQSYELAEYSFATEDGTDGYATQISNRYFLETAQFLLRTSNQRKGNDPGWCKVWTAHLPRLE